MELKSEKIPGMSATRSYISSRLYANRYVIVIWQNTQVGSVFDFIVISATRAGQVCQDCGQN